MFLKIHHNSSQNSFQINQFITSDHELWAHAILHGNPCALGEELHRLKNRREHAPGERNAYPRQEHGELREEDRREEPVVRLFHFVGSGHADVVDEYPHEASEEVEVLIVKNDGSHLC